MLPRATTTRTQRDVVGRQGERPDTGNPTSHRPLAPQRRADGEARRANRVGGLRRHPGRRRHAHGVDHAAASSRSCWRSRSCASRTSSAGFPVTDYVAATSVGVIGGTPMLDLAYEEDSRAEVDMNVIKTGAGRFIEVQGTAEGEPFDRDALDNLLDLAGAGITALVGLAARARRLIAHVGGSRGRAHVGTDPSHCDDQRRQASRDSRTARGSALTIVRRWTTIEPPAAPEETGDTFAANARLKALFVRATRRAC